MAHNYNSTIAGRHRIPLNAIPHRKRNQLICGTVQLQWLPDLIRLLPREREVAPLLFTWGGRVSGHAANKGVMVEAHEYGSLCRSLILSSERGIRRNH